MNIPASSNIELDNKSETLSAANPMQAHTRLMGQILLEMGKITLEDTENILQLQQQSGMLFGDAARQLGLITDIDVQQVLAGQFDYPYLLPGQENYSPELVVAYQPFCAQVEAIRAMRSQLVMRWFSKGHKSMAVVGINPECGSSLLVANLAVLFSQLGQRTLLIDANLREPGQHKIFNLHNKQGLSDVLAGRVELSNVISKLEPFVGLNVLSAGTRPPNPSELLSRTGFINVSENIASQFDIVLYDAPAFMSSTDAFLIAARAGGVLLVIHKHNTRFADIQAVSEQITCNGANIIGTVLIDL
ncbi:MAG TPA: chain length determinant protein tyrosine kinase EpsG [Nitrosomonas sp.]|nr:chain length determinant protein tyrosine kinase EpsG [Nitrosomonas sp.]